MKTSNKITVAITTALYFSLLLRSFIHPSAAMHHTLPPSLPPRPPGCTSLPQPSQRVINAAVCHWHTPCNNWTVLICVCVRVRPLCSDSSSPRTIRVAKTSIKKKEGDNSSWFLLFFCARIKSLWWYPEWQQTTSSSWLPPAEWTSSTFSSTGRDVSRLQVRTKRAGFDGISCTEKQNTRWVDPSFMFVFVGFFCTVWTQPRFKPAWLECSKIIGLLF